MAVRNSWIKQGGKRLFPRNMWQFRYQVSQQYILTFLNLIEEFHKNDMTTFVVTNGTIPDMVEKIKPTQLYISLNAPDENTYEKACSPIGNSWENIKQSLEILKRSGTRTAIRITLTKGVNMVDPEGYARLIGLAQPDYVELKAYMHLGFSRKRLSQDNMPSHDEVLGFSRQVAEALEYRIADDSSGSRVVLLSKDGGKQNI